MRSRRAEERRTDVLKQRHDRFDNALWVQIDLDLERCVFIDETPAFAGAGSKPPPTSPAAMAAAGQASACRWAVRTATVKPPRW